MSEGRGQINRMRARFNEVKNKKEEAYSMSSPRSPYELPEDRSVMEPFGYAQAGAKALSGMITGGDKNEWFPRQTPFGEMPIPLYAAGNAFLDTVADPFNALGMGLFGKGTKAANQIYGNIGKADRGLLTAVADNYIDEHYVPNPDKPLSFTQNLANKALTSVRDNPDGVIAKVANKLVPKQAQTARGLGDEELRGAAQKIGSTGSTVVTAARNAFLDALNPEARALWRSQGISRTGQNIITNHLKRHDDLTRQIEQAVERGDTKAEEALKALRTKERSVAKAGAETIYQLHQATQSGRIGPTSDVLRKFESQVFDELPQDNNAGTIADIIQRHSPQTNTVEQVTLKNGKTKNVRTWVDEPVSPEDAKFLENAITDAWGTTKKIVVKTPENTVSGKHLNDLVGQRNPSMMAFKRILKNPPKKGQSWFDNVQESVDQYNKTAKYEVTVLGEGDNVWLSSSRPGTAIVEGGYRGFHKINPDGSFIAVGSDVHDFLEKAPVLGRAIKRYLPEDLIAITPPIKGRLGANNKAITGVYRTASTARKEAAKKAKDVTETSMSLLTQIPDIKADPRAVTAEIQRQAGAGMLIGSSLRGREEEQ